MTDNEQLTLNFPAPTEHGVVVDRGHRTEWYQVGSEDRAQRLADKIRAVLSNVVWDEAPKASGWYGLRPTPGGSIVFRIATY